LAHVRNLAHLTVIRASLAQFPHRSRPVWFGPADAPLFGLVNSPETEARGAVVICPPFGREYVNSYSTFVQLATRLEYLGFLVLRFDYRSTGDSFDRTTDSSGPSGFVDDVRYAVDCARELGAAHVAIVGMRVGATFAGLQSALNPVDALVLWDPCPTGRSFLREQLALGLLIREKGAVGSREDAPVGPESAAAFEIPGFSISPELLDEMSQLDLTGTGGVLADKVLLLTRSERAADHKTAARLERANLEHREVKGQSELLDVQAPTQIVPSEAVATVADWLDQVMSRSQCPVTLPAEREVTVRVTSRDHVGATLDGEVGVVERDVVLGPAGLFGIATEPEFGGSGPVCIFVSVSNEHRVGPGRLWVELSRRLAARGFRCVRLDLNGVGNSPARDGKSRQPIFSASAIDDVVDAARSVSPLDPSDVVLFGLCSSGYHVLEAAAILSARGVCAVNPIVKFPPPEIAEGGIMDARRRFCVPQRELVSVSQRQAMVRWFGRRFPRVNRRVRRVIWKLRRLTWNARGHLRTLAWQARSLLGAMVIQPGERLGELAESGTDVFLIGGPEELRAFQYSAVPRVQRAQRDGHLRMEEISALDHAIRRSSDRDLVTELTIDHVVDHFSSIRTVRGLHRTGLEGGSVAVQLGDAHRPGIAAGPHSQSRTPVVVASMMRAVGTTGVQTHVRETCDFLVGRGNPPILVTPFSWGGPLSNPVFGARRLLGASGAASVAWYRYWHFLFLSRALQRTLAQMDNAVVYAQCPLSALAALRARRDPSQRVVIAIHFTSSTESRWSEADEWVDKGQIRRDSLVYRRILELEGRVLPAVDGIVYVSDAARRGLVNQSNALDRVRSSVIPNFVTVPPTSQTEYHADLVTVGNLEVVKNHQFLLEVLSATNRMGRHYTLDILGDGPCRIPLMQRAISLGLDGQVHFLGARTDVLALLPGHRAYVHSSNRENLPLAIIEAMGSGLAVVSGKVGGIPELIEPGVEGIFWPLDDSQEAARVLIDLLEDQERLSQLSAAARRRFERSFDAEVIGPVLERFLESVAREGDVLI